MDRLSIETSLRMANGNKAFISSHKLKIWLGVGEPKFREFVKGMDVRVSGNTRLYFIGDVAEKILGECDAN